MKIAQKYSHSISSWRIELFFGYIYFIGIGVIYFSYMFLTLLWSRGFYWPGLFIFYLFTFFIIWLVGFSAGLQFRRIEKIAMAEIREEGLLKQISVACSIGFFLGGLVFAVFLYPSFDLITIGLIITLCHQIQLRPRRTKLVCKNCRVKIC